MNSRIETTVRALQYYAGALWRWLGMLILVWLAAGCSPSSPDNQQDICQIFRQQPRWYDYAKAAEVKWGTSIATQMAFIQFESSFYSHIRPPGQTLFGLFTWDRPSSAYGYAQAQNPAWRDYLNDGASPLARRTHMRYATDFIGWYNQRSHHRVNIALDNPTHLYLAYHEGLTGYERGRYQNKPHVLHTARQVGTQARLFAHQLAQCEYEFVCDGFYQIGPFCRK
ncbi:hypothetical protein [Methylophaga pinxianii]|uniref:transglycosylase SLT domain-containing protein n=1 Tax=Methylophaga pinxianii TaxID=2881052 RepID=UPI001CF530F7|nr:hypothetical protein [Methylophaga pinxianii]MCB2427935.1 hypothetical protein [Methylophaga pinxianii]UPH44426.1 hypothetical protein LGT42_007810 [Methylophaga pinxianii]